MIDRQLRELGLSEHEAKVCGALLERSPLGAAAIAKACGLSRTTVYTVLGALAGKGLVSTTYKNEVKQFVATGVDAFTQRVQHERESLAAKERVLGELSAHLATIRRDDLHVPRVQLFEGVEGLQRIYLAMLREAPPRSELLVLRSEFIWEPVWAFAWEEEWRSRIRRWKREKDIRTRLLVNASPLELGKDNFYRTRFQVEFRYLPEGSAVDRFALYIIGDTAAILSFETGNLIGLHIVNVHLAENFTRMFDGLWRLADRAAVRGKRK